MKSPIKIIGIVVLVLGLIGAIYGGFTYTRETHDAKIGPIELSVKDKETVRVPLWAGLVAVAAGAALIMVPVKARS